MSGVRATNRPNTVAPWAEIVPDAGPMTVEDLVSLPDGGSRYELVEGVLVRMAGSGEQATTIALILGAAMLSFVLPRRLGVVTGADGVYTFPTAETGLLPDVGFYLAARRQLVVDRTKPIPFAPDLAVEVASPSQDAGDMAEKVIRYLQGGTHLVWVLWPARKQIDVWRSGGRAPALTLDSADSLDGEDLIAGFSFPVSAVFADPLG